MALQTRYITVDEFKEWSGIDLSVLRDDANPSNKEVAFLRRIEDRMETLIDVACFRKVSFEYPQFNDYQKEHYKRALMEQAIYIFRNGEISTDSGYDMEKGIVTPQGQLQDLALAPNAKRELEICGLWTKKIRFSDLGWRAGFGWWW